MSIQYKELLHNISDWLWEVDNKNIYTYCSENVLQTLGFNAKEMIDKTPFDFMSEEEAKRVIKIFTFHSLKKEPIVDCESVYIHKDGSEVTVRTNAIPILNENGDVVNFQGLAKDISEQKSILKETEILQERLGLALQGSNDRIL